MYIKEMRVFGFKRFSKLQVEFSPGINIVVGDNDAGKSTLLEAITAVLDGQYRGTSLARNLSEDLFNAENVATYIKIFVQELNANRQRFLSKLYLVVMTKKNY